MRTEREVRSLLKTWEEVRDEWNDATSDTISAVVKEAEIKIGMLKWVLGEVE
jgi:hypothetical protein